MICKNCMAENEANATLCQKCGSSLQTPSIAMADKSKLSDIIIIGISIFLMFSKLFWLAFSRISSEHWKAFQPVNHIFSLVWAAIPILLAFVVKNRVWKIILLVSGGIYALLSIIDLIRIMFMSNNFVYFKF
jgi:hypothetical protein